MECVVHLSRCCSSAGVIMSSSLKSFEMLWKAGRQDEAIKGLREHLRQDTTDAQAWSLYGLYLLKIGERSQALGALTRSVKLSPTYAAAYNAGNLLMDADRLDEALHMYDVSIDCYRKYPQTWVNRGIVLHRLEHTQRALESFDQALRLNPSFLPAMRCKAIALEDLGDKVGSERMYAAMVKAFPGNLSLLSEYGRALARLPNDNHMELEPHGREWQAIEILNTVLEQHPEDLSAWRAKADVLFRCMHANVCFRTIGRDGFKFVPGPLASGSFAGDLIPLLEAAMTRFPKDPSFPEWMAGACIFQGDLASAVQHRERVCQLTPNDPSAFAALFESCVEARHNDQAADALTRAIELDARYLALLDDDCPPAVADMVRQRLAHITDH